MSRCYRRGVKRCSVLLTLACACATTEPSPDAVAAEAAPEPIAAKPTTMPKSAPDDAPSADIDAAQVEAEALRCDGPALMQRGASAIGALSPDDAALSASLLAAWERGRAFDDRGTIEPAGVDEMLPRFTAALGMAPPRWWVDTLKSARGGEGIATGYDLQMAQDGYGDRRGKLSRGPGGVLIRGTSPLVESDGMLAYDLSSGRVELGPVPSHRGTAIEVTRARAGTTLYVAMFEPGAGGFRFPLRAVASDGKERWVTEVCAADRKVLGGLGYMVVQMVVLEDPPAKPGVMSTSNARGLAVFTAETHGVTVEVFELDTGARTLAWSSDLWSWRG